MIPLQTVPSSLFLSIIIHFRTRFCRFTSFCSHSIHYISGFYNSIHCFRFTTTIQSCIFIKIFFPSRSKVKLIFMSLCPIFCRIWWAWRSATNSRFRYAPLLATITMTLIFSASMRTLTIEIAIWAVQCPVSLSFFRWYRIDPPVPDCMIIMFNCWIPLELSCLLLPRYGNFFNIHPVTFSTFTVRVHLVAGLLLGLDWK